MWLQRFLLWERRNNTVMPFKETVQQVWARISALRDSLDGPQAGPTTRAIFLVHAHRRPAGLALHLGTKQVSGQPPGMRYSCILSILMPMCIRLMLFKENVQQYWPRISALRNFLNWHQVTAISPFVTIAASCESRGCPLGRLCSRYGGSSPLFDPRCMGPWHEKSFAAIIFIQLLH